MNRVNKREGYKVPDSRRVKDEFRYRNTDNAGLFDALDDAFGGSEVRGNSIDVYVHDRIVNVEVSADNVAYICSRGSNDVSEVDRNDYVDDEAFYNGVISTIRNYVFKQKYRFGDSRKIKDADDTNTDDVIDGILIITFKDGSQEDGLKAVQEHANEQGDGYETYEVKEQDGKVGVDMCAQTSDPNSFVKELLKAWGVLDAVADVDFKKSDLMEEAEQQEEVSDSKKITDSTYGTSFTLTNPVNDYNAASDYLQADDMTEYLIDDLDYLGLSHLEGKIKEIKWVLEDEQTGYIVLYTTEPLAQEDLDKISEWISGQCSDGLGEGFEQQPFAEVRYYDEYDYNDEYGHDDYDTDMASFDWETNDYKLKLYDSARVKNRTPKK